MVLDLEWEDVFDLIYQMQEAQQRDDSDLPESFMLRSMRRTLDDKHRERLTLKFKPYDSLKNVVGSFDALLGKSETYYQYRQIHGAFTLIMRGITVPLREVPTLMGTQLGDVLAAWRFKLGQ